MMYDPATGIIICVLINQLPAQAYQVSTLILATLINNSVDINKYNVDTEHFLYFPTLQTDLFILIFLMKMSSTFKSSIQQGNYLR